MEIANKRSKSQAMEDKKKSGQRRNTGEGTFFRFGNGQGKCTIDGCVYDINAGDALVIASRPGTIITSATGADGKLEVSIQTG